MKVTDQKVAPLKNEFHKEQIRLLQAEEKAFQGKQRRLIAISLVALVIIGIAFTHVFQMGKKISALRNQAETALVKETTLKKQEANLTDEVALLKNEDYVAKLARSRYFYSKPGEQVFIFPNEELQNTLEKDSSNKDKIATPAEKHK